MKRKVYITAVFVIVALAAALWVRAGSESGADDAPAPIGKGEGVSMLSLDKLRITVVYDNNPGAPGLRAEWGFACLVEGADKRILFDTGGDAPVLLANMDSLSIDPGDIDVVVLSHKHEDHTGGVRALLGVNPDVMLYVPESFSGEFKSEMREAGAEVIEVKSPLEICGGVYSIGQMGTLIKEHSLALATDRGLIVITGCAHPGIVSIVERAREAIGGDVLLAMGGFHLRRDSDDTLDEVIAGFRDAGVLYAAPCHCSGDRARERFGQAYGDNYLELVVGTVLEGSVLR